MKHLGPIAGIASRGDLIATAGYDNRLILWHADSRRALQTGFHDHLVNHCEFSADGHWLVSASSDYSARLWKLPELQLHAVLGGHGDDVDMAVFCPQVRRIATCALDRCVRIFDLQGHCLHTMLGHTGNVLSVAWTHDGTHVVSSSVDGTIRVWDAQRGVQVRLNDLQVRTDSVEIATSGVVFAGDDRGRIARIAGEQIRFVAAHKAGVKKIVLNERQGILVSLSYDRSMAIWRITPADASSGNDTGPDAPWLTEISRSTLPATIWARSATVLDDGRVACATFGGSYALFAPDTGRWDLHGVGAGAAINAVAVHDAQVMTVGDAGTVWRNGHVHAEMGSLCNFLVASGAQLVTGGQLGQLYDAHTGAVLYEHHSPLNCGVAFERHGTPHLAIGTYTGEILVFALETQGPLRAHLVLSISVYENAVKGLSVSAGQLFSVCACTDIAWHSVQDWSLIRHLRKAHERIANACCSWGEGRFASVSRDRQLRLWSAQGCESFASPHANSVKCMAVNAGHTHILTGSYGGTLALFDLVRRQWAGFSRPTHAGISCICWDPQQQRFLASSYDGQIHPVDPLCADECNALEQTE